MTFPTWEILPGVEKSKGLQRAAKVFEWMERFLYIRLKDNAEQALAPYRLNTVQQIIAQYIAACWHVGIPVKCVCPKARQMGISTFWQALGYTLCQLFPGYNTAVVAHIEEAATEIFGKSKIFDRNIRGWHLDKIADQRGRMEWVNSSASHCGSIKTADGLLMGFTLNMIHWSEVANFCDRGNDAYGALASARPALAQTDMTVEVFESTAKGKDPLYWPMCEEARDPHSGSDYTLLFLPWFLQKEYSISWDKYRNMFLEKGKNDPGPQFKPTPEENNLRKSLAQVEVEPWEKYHKYRVDLTDDQLIWRRWAIQNICRGDIDTFKRFYPASYEEAFTASASCMFDNDTLRWYQSRTRTAPNFGNVENAGKVSAFVSNPKGYVSMWESPNPRDEYVIGADIGGERKKSDPSCAYVINKHTLQVMACWHGYAEWDFYADALYDLGRYYNWALLVVENNVNPAVAKRLHREGYPNLYYYFDDATGQGGGRVPGFNTNTKTRNEILDTLDQACRGRRLKNPDRFFPSEMETFIWVPKSPGSTSGKYMATGSNKDDRIMAAALAVFHCARETARVDGPEVKEKKKSFAQQYYEELMREARFEKEEGFLNLSASPRGRK